MNPMNDDINDYRRWKQQGESLRVRAKQSLETRFRDCLLEAVQIAEEYREDFGAPLKPPPAITSFRYKATPKKGAKKALKGAPAKAIAARPEPPTKADVKPDVKIDAKPDPKVVELQKKLAAAKKKLEAAKAAGSATKNIEDRIYEIEDDLRLASGRVQ
jgi:hypothetical protein